MIVHSTKDPSKIRHKKDFLLLTCAPVAWKYCKAIHSGKCGKKTICKTYEIVFKEIKRVPR